MSKNSEEIALQRAKAGLKVTKRYYDKTLKKIEAGIHIPSQEWVNCKNESEEYIRGLEIFTAGMIFGVGITVDTEGE